MPINWSIDDGLSIIRVVLTGTVTDEDLQALYTGVIAADEFEKGFPVLLDGTGVADLKVSTAYIHRMAIESAKHPNIMAMVMSKGVGFGLARMYQTLTDSDAKTVNVFSDKDQALSWLLDQRR